MAYLCAKALSHLLLYIPFLTLPNGSDFILHLEMEEIRLHLFDLPEEGEPESATTGDLEPECSNSGCCLLSSLHSPLHVMIEYLERIKRWVLSQEDLGSPPASGTAWPCAPGQAIFLFEPHLWIKLKIVLPPPWDCGRIKWNNAWKAHSRMFPKC